MAVVRDWEEARVEWVDPQLLALAELVFALIVGIKLLTRPANLAIAKSAPSVALR